MVELFTGRNLASFLRLKPMRRHFLAAILCLAAGATNAGAAVMTFSPGALEIWDPCLTGPPCAIGNKAFVLRESGMELGGYIWLDQDHAGQHTADGHQALFQLVGGGMFDPISIDVIGGPWGGGAFMPGIFTSSKGGQVVVGAGTFTFPDTPQWRGLTSLSWALNPNELPDGYCFISQLPCAEGLLPWTFSATRIDNFQFDVVPEPGLLVLGAIGTGALMRRRYAGR
jgi:hypothetical protein